MTWLLKSGAPLSDIRQFFSRNLASWHHVSHLRGFIRSLKLRPNWSFHSTRPTMIFFYYGKRFSAGTWPSSVHECRARSVGHRITSNRGLGIRSPPVLHSLTKNTSFGHKHRDFLQLDTMDTRAAALGMQSYGRSYFCLLNGIFGCVKRNFDTIFDPDLPKPNRIFGLLNLSIIKKDGSETKKNSTHCNINNLDCVS